MDNNESAMHEITRTETRHAQPQEDKTKLQQTKLQPIVQPKPNSTMTNDLKATIAGVVAGIVMILKTAGVHIEVAPWLLDVIASIAVVAIGFFANRKDAK